MRHSIRERDLLYLNRGSSGGSGGGTDTSDATATANDVLSGKTAYVNGGKITGNIESFNGSYECSTDSTSPSGWDSLDALLDGSITEITSNVEFVTNYGCRSRSSLKRLNLPLAISVLTESFYCCSELETVNAPNLGYVAAQAFEECKKLTNLNAPNVKTICEKAFYSCSILPQIDFPKTVTIQSKAFQWCTNLVTANFSSCVNFGAGVFHGCNLLNKLILRSETMCTLSNTNAFTGCFHILGTVNETYNPNGDKDGYIYVPRALLSDDDATKDYRRATNWTTYASQFRALEDYTIDGTITGALDESKI